MKEIVLPWHGTRIPAVGLGCSSLTGTSRSDALRVLETAFDLGVRYFDVARYYGYGEAEGILGTFIKSRRLQVTIATKFGIEPPKRTSALRVALRAGRRLGRFLPSAREFMQRSARPLMKSGAFSVRDAKLSLETSLRALGTDHIDVYLLHDYAVSAHDPDELLTFLESVVNSQKILCFGIGTGFHNVLQVLDCQPRLCNVIQFQNSVLTRNTERLPVQTSDRLVITHGALGEGYQRLSSFLRTHTNAAKDWAAKLGLSALDEDTLAALMLAYAIDANPNGPVLFSSRDPARVKKNMEALSKPRFQTAQIALFGELVSRVLPIMTRQG